MSLKEYRSFTINEYIAEKKKDITQIHDKAKALLGITHVTWTKKRETGIFKTDEIYLLSNELFHCKSEEFFVMAVNTYLKNNK